MHTCKTSFVCVYLCVCVRACVRVYSRMCIYALMFTRVRTNLLFIELQGDNSWQLVHIQVTKAQDTFSLTSHGNAQCMITPIAW